MEDISKVIVNTTLHSRRVSYSVCQIAQKVVELNIAPNVDIAEITVLAVLHDIGKYELPPHLLNKKGILTDDEWKLIKEHSEFSYKMLKGAGFSERACNIVRWHHEKLDGSGYPDGIKDIPIESQIIAVADIYDAMTHNRPYRSGVYSHKETIEEMRQNKGLNMELVDIVDMLFRGRNVDYLTNKLEDREILVG